MSKASSKLRVEQALAAAEPFPALWQLTAERHDSGLSQTDLHALLKSFLARHSADAEEVRYNAPADTLEFIVGWCLPGKALYLAAPAV